jgi:hypothetical protein
MADFPCPCISLRTGALIVAILQVTGYSCRLIFTFLLLALLPQAQKELEENNFDPSIYGSKMTAQQVINASYAFGAMGAISNSIGLFVAIMLYIGIKRSDRRLMLAWLLIETFNVTFQFIVFLIPYSYTYSSLPWDVLMAIVRLYFLIVVYAHYDELKAAEIPVVFSPPIISVGGPFGL